jgi:shikimate dehydrogenase
MNVYGLIGQKLSHSFSKKYFTQKFEKNHIKNCAYELFELSDINQISTLLNNQPNLKGLNVTIPYKEKIIPFLNEIDNTAKEVGAVNCIKIIRKQNSLLLKGYNTDVYGFSETIKPYTAQTKKALILGTGGASKAVSYVLQKMKIEHHFVSTSKKENSFTFEQLQDVDFSSIQLIVNTTPIGMFPSINDLPNIPFQKLNNTHILIDLIYNPLETLFLKKGKLQGAQTMNGLSMLENQAEKSWEIWQQEP